MKNRGQLVEDEFIVHLNEKKVGELSDSVRYLLEDLFGVVDRNDRVKCEKAEDWIKPDIIITYKGKRKGVSIKSGNADMFHSEQLQNFIPYLRSIGVSKETLRTILLFHYGDGTVNGTGKRRYKQDEVAEWLKDRLEDANEELNDSDLIVETLINRFLFDGVNPEAEKATAIYMGDVYNGFTLTKKQMSKFIKNANYSFYKNLHIGPLLLVPGARYVNRPVKDERKRQIIQAWWPNANKVMHSIADKYFTYTPLHHRTYDE